MERNRAHWRTVWHVSVVRLITFGFILALTGCVLKEATAEHTKHRTSPEYAVLAEALSARWNPDDTIPSASMGFDSHASGDEVRVRLSIEVSTTATCDDSATDPCERLADELAAIVLANYGLVDELDGIRVVIGSEPHDLSVEPSDVLLEKSLSIAEWRDALGNR
jgi:hypothetical protein